MCHTVVSPITNHRVNLAADETLSHRYWYSEAANNQTFNSCIVRPSSTFPAFLPDFGLSNTHDRTLFNPSVARPLHLPSRLPRTPMFVLSPSDRISHSFSNLHLTPPYPIGAPSLLQPSRGDRQCPLQHCHLAPARWSDQHFGHCCSDRHQHPCTHLLNCRLHIRFRK